MMSVEQVTAVLDACDVTEAARDDIERNPVRYEQLGETIDVSIDGVVVKQQKLQRTRAHDVDAPKAGEEDTTKTGRKYAQNTVAHLQDQTHAYGIVGHSVPAVLRILVSSLPINDMMGKRLPFFVDGQKTLQSAILKAFAWPGKSGLILAWYHLEDRCARQLSLAMKGAVLRNEALSTLSALLWYGRVDSAHAFLQGLSAANLKKPDEIRVLHDYREGRRPTCPAMPYESVLDCGTLATSGKK